MKTRRQNLFLLALPVALLALPACGSKDNTPAQPPQLTASSIRPLFAAWPMAPEAPVASSETLVALGNRLYHEKALSASGDISCASCHSIENYGQDNKPFSPGTSGLMGGRSTPSSFNAFRQFAQFWDGRAASVEEQSTMPMLTDVEHGLASENQIVEILNQQEGYPEAFAAAFPSAASDEIPEGPITADRVRAAIGAFERTLITRSPFDAWVEGDDQALTEVQFEGLQAFVNAGCVACHSTRAVGGHMFQKLGLVAAVDSADLGVFKVTGKESDKRMFKVPALLNVTETAPYLHDGSMETLAEAVQFMSTVQVGKPLDEAQVTSIVAFLGSLKGTLQ